MAEVSKALPTVSQDHSRAGFAYALSAFTFWGFLPFFMKAVAHIDTLEVLAHRVIWSIPIALAVLLFTGRTNDLVRVLTSPRKLVVISISAAVISLNWGIYVWSIAAERSIEAALGYYINPLITVALGTIFLGEKMDRLQMTAIALAALAVVILSVSAGVIPWVAIVLACSFATYGFIRKTVDIGPTQGFMMEVLILSTAAIPFAIWLGMTGEAKFGLTTYDTLFLLACGPVTAIPLILFAYGAKRLRLSTIGLMQYIVPTMIFLIGVFIFREPFNQWQLISFMLIWLAIALYTWSSLKNFRTVPVAH
ncbi:MAG: EamA family transporter RarD [Rhizobiaceae bacterium]|nr:EamA family transporter RarD [Rhizobiaceae bacterium]